MSPPPFPAVDINGGVVKFRRFRNVVTFTSLALLATVLVIEAGKGGSGTERREGRGEELDWSVTDVCRLTSRRI